MGRKSHAKWSRAHSAGGVVVRRDECGRHEFLAIKPVNRDRWQLPKGTIDPGETSPVTAVREVREEGGVDARILSDLGPINFVFQMAGRHIAKRVDFYLMEYVSGSPADHDHEVQDARWFPVDDIHRLAFATERDVVERARAQLLETSRD
jgi:8-oxo-dGTP pyrophosphatase MutT (NUDIX family)